MITDARRFYERASIEHRVHHAVKCRPVRLSKIIHKHPRLSIAKHNRIPRRFIPSFFVYRKVSPVRQATSIVDDYHLAALNGGSRVVFTYQLATAASRHHNRQAFLEPLWQGHVWTSPDP